MHKLKLVTYASTLLLVAGIASATDLNNINKINPDADGKVEFGGFIDMNSNSISEVGTPQDSDDAAPRSWINDNDDVIPDTTVPDDQNVQVSSSGDTITVSIDNGNGGSASITDNVQDADSDPNNEIQGLGSVLNNGVDAQGRNLGGTGGVRRLNFDNREAADFSCSDTEADSGVFFDRSDGLYVCRQGNKNIVADQGNNVNRDDNQNIQASASGDTISISIDNGNGASATITDNVQDADSSPTNELQDLENVRSRSNNVNGNIDFQSAGSIVSLENLNVNSINSNKGNDPVDLDQGADVEAALMIPVGPDSYY